MMLSLFNSSDKFVPILFDEAGECIHSIMSRI